MSNLVTGLVCGGITLGLYALCCFLAIRLLLPLWRAGRNPLEEFWNRTEHGQKALAVMARQQSLYQHLSVEKLATVNVRLAAGEDIDQIFHGLSEDIPPPGVGTCHWCEKNAADPRRAHYSKKVRYGKRYKSHRSAGMTIYKQSRHVTINTYPRCENCAHIHRRVGLAWSWTVVGGAVLFLLMTPFFAFMASVLDPGSLLVLLGTFAVAILIGIPWVTLHRDSLRTPPAFDQRPAPGQTKVHHASATSSPESFTTLYDFERSCARDFGEHVRHRLSTSNKVAVDLALRSLTFVSYNSDGPTVPSHMRIFVERNASNGAVLACIGGRLTAAESAEVLSAGERYSVDVLSIAIGEQEFVKVASVLANQKAGNLKQNHRVVLQQNRREWLCAVVSTLLLILGVVLFGLGGWIVSDDPDIVENTPLATRLATVGGRTAASGVLMIAIGFGMLIASVWINDRRRRWLLHKTKAK